MKVLICGGGTGGHIYPALSTVASLREMGISNENILWIGTRGEIETTLVPKEGIRLETIIGGAIAGVSWPRRFANAAKLTWSIGKSMRIVSEFGPDALLMTGGYVNLPVALSAWLQRVPSLIYLPDIEPGLAIRYLSYLARRIACTAEQSLKYFPPGKTIVTGYPVRSELRDALGETKKAALERFGLSEKLPTLFVFGGSRGARSINRALMAVLPQLLPRLQIIHISGKLDWLEIEKAANDLPSELRENYRPFPYLHQRMGLAFRASDLVLARAGASMMGECPAFGLPAILVPYPYAWRYQKVNADYLAGNGAAIVLADADLPDRLVQMVQDLVNDRSLLTKMGEAAKSLDRPEASDNLARVIIALSEQGKS